MIRDLGTSSPLLREDYDYANISFAENDLIVVESGLATPVANLDTGTNTLAQAAAKFLGLSMFRNVISDSIPRSQHVGQAFVNESLTQLADIDAGTYTIGQLVSFVVVSGAFANQRVAITVSTTEAIGIVVKNAPAGSTQVVVRFQGNITRQ